MKKLFFILGICGIIAACNSGKSDSTASENQATTAQQSNVDTTATTTTAPASGGNGEQLIAKNGCLTCHKVDVKLIGPAYKEVAAKYPATTENIAMLAGKIISGGAGNWGDVPMIPHPTVTVSDAKEMVTYILALK